MCGCPWRQQTYCTVYHTAEQLSYMIVYRATLSQAGPVHWSTIASILARRWSRWSIMIARWWTSLQLTLPFKATTHRWKSLLMDLQCRNTSSSPNQLKKFIPIVSSHRVQYSTHTFHLFSNWLRFVTMQVSSTYSVLSRLHGPAAVSEPIRTSLSSDAKLNHAQVAERSSRRWRGNHGRTISQVSGRLLTNYN